MEEKFAGNTNKIIRKLYVNIDGASRGNPGPSSISVVVKDSYGHTLEEFKEFVGRTTCNHAEYLAAIKALEIAAKYCRNIVYVFTDSKLLVNQLSGRYRIRRRRLLQALIEIKLLEGLFRTVRFFHIDRSYNRRADALASQAIKNSSTGSQPHKVFFHERR